MSGRNRRSLFVELHRVSSLVCAASTFWRRHRPRERHRGPHLRTKQLRLNRLVYWLIPM